MSLEYDLAIAEEELEKAEREAREYLVIDCDDYWFNYFKNRINTIIKRNGPSLYFGDGASVEWYVEAFRLFSKWLEAEHEHSKLMARKYNDPLV